jgi:small-conductance mechanosensitive channel
LWDEIMVPVTYASDWQRATEIMLELGQHYTAELHADAEAKLQRMIDRYPLQLTSVAPTIYLTMTDNWVEVTLRYIVDAMQRRKTKAELNQELLQRFQAEPDITVASMTVEIVGLPPLRGAAGPVRDA